MISAQPIDLLIRKFASHVRLDDEDAAAIRALNVHQQTVPALQYVVREGEPPIDCPVLVSGFACREKFTSEGKRQIVAVSVPGEAMDLQGLFLAQADHSIVTLTDCILVMVSRVEFRSLMLRRPNIATAAIVCGMAEASMMRAWLLNNGKRSALNRLAHFVSEMVYRMEAQKLGRYGYYTLPMTQEQLGDVLGLTAVHVNRSLRILAEHGLIERRGRGIRVLDRNGLWTAGDFNPGYLHLKARQTLT